MKVKSLQELRMKDDDYKEAKRLQSEELQLARDEVDLLKRKLEEMENTRVPTGLQLKSNNGYEKSLPDASGENKELKKQCSNMAAYIRRVSAVCRVRPFLLLRLTLYVLSLNRSVMDECRTHSHTPCPVRQVPPR